MRKLTSLLLPVSVLALGLPGLATQAQAAGAQEDEAIEEIVTTGLRGRPRSSVDSAVPIDTFDTSSIEAVSHTDTQDILRTLVPSINIARSPIADGATFIRNTELRGLPAHHTLVLVNGKRRHRASLVGIGGSGRQGPDVATIPSSAIQSIEVLRDGASSQYGSDAIAGVVNFNLKNNSEGFTLVADTGEFFEGDGAGYTVSGNVGLPLGENGFFSVSAEINEADFTERNEQYCESFFCADPNGSRFASTVAANPQRADYAAGIATPGLTAFENALQLAFPAGVQNASVVGQNVQPWGQPNAESVRVFYNAGLELNNGMELYSFGNYSDSSGDGGFFYRFPGNGTIELLRNADGSLYSPLEKFPGGFTPRFEGEIEDLSFAAGLRGTTDNDFSWDVSARYGSNEISYRLFNTINPSYGVDSPTDFRPGTLENEEFQVQVDLANAFDIGTASDLVLAYGVSFLDETYNVGESADLASYDPGPHAQSDPFGFCDGGVGGTPSTAPNGVSSIGGQAGVSGVDAVANFGLDCSDPNDPAFTIVGVGSNGFPGFSPAFSDDFERDSIAVYADLSTDVSDSFFIQAAIRYEDYSDFGDELVGKLAGRYLLNENFAVRASIGTGFRAPTPGQQGTTNVSTRLPNGVPVATGLFPPSGAVAQALGATPLRAETSTNYTVGFTADIENLSLTVDYYQIDIDDRFNSISTRDVSATAAPGSEAFMNFQALSNAGVVGAESIGGVFYFTNAFDSRTRGLDIVASYPFDWDNGQSTNLQLAYNWNESELASDASEFLNAENAFDFENARPTTRWNLTANHTIGDFSILGRALFYGEYENSQRSFTSPPLFIQRFDRETFYDLELSWQLNDNWRLTGGGRNIFDSYPDETDRNVNGNDFCCGRIYDSGSVVPWQGGYYYGRVTVSF